MKIVTKYQMSAIKSCWEKWWKISWDGQMDRWKDGRTDRGKTVYLPPPLGCGGIIILTFSYFPPFGWSWIIRQFSLYFDFWNKTCCISETIFTHTRMCLLLRETGLRFPKTPNIFLVQLIFMKRLICLWRRRFMLWSKWSVSLWFNWLWQVWPMNWCKRSFIKWICCLWRVWLSFFDRWSVNLWIWSSGVL